MRWRDRLHGGRADRFTPADFDRHQLRRGARVEREHTRSRHLAEEIAMDHLVEDPAYYRKLRKVHLDGLVPKGFWWGVVASFVGSALFYFVYKKVD